MEDRILEFIKGLRGRGVSVSTAESIDALGAVAAVGLDDPGLFKAALKAATVKRNRDVPIFEELFPLYFYGLESGQETDKLDDDLLARLEERLSQMAQGGEMDSMLPMVLSGQAGEWESFIRMAAGEVGTAQLATRMQVGMYTRRIFDTFDWENMERVLHDLIEQLREEGWSEEELQRVEEAFAANREALRKQVRRYVEREQARNADKVPNVERIERLMNRPLAGLDEYELQQMRKVVDILARKLRNKINLREKKLKRGKLDVKATLRRNMQHGGVPFELKLKHKRMEKAELMVLCDISSSVARVSQFMLQFVYTIQDCLAKVRSFVFVDDLGEVTDFFRDEDIQKGIRRALSEADISYNARSDFGEVFQLFCDQYLQDVGFRTYILVIGDARNNYNDPGLRALERIRDRAKGIIWLNPETKPFWDTGDSVMGDYLPYLKEARVCRTLKDLEDTVSSLLL
ncbi:MAG: VWA domain-containing protein [Actinomycetota bacterium]|nr:VWA domain-containing protein [Actinomycetota bacterium]MDD5666791.1 VWA domain-containing protein [Actinomycetota bacterium]